MNADQYNQLCEACDRLLLAPDSTEERVAISWLHVIREHPLFLVNYQFLFLAKSGLKSFFHHNLHSLRNLMVFAKELFVAFESGSNSWYGRKKFSKNVDILFVSHLINLSQTRDSSDFYFGDIPKQLHQNNYTIATALINHTESNGDDLIKFWPDKNPHILILSKSLNFFQEISNWFNLRKESRRLRAKAYKETDIFFRNILLQASQEANSSSSRANIRLGIQIQELVNQLRPTTIIVTHEGHGWERLAFSFARTANPKIRCIAYQHAAVFRLQHAIRRNLSCKYNPDVILTSGLVAKEMLEQSNGLSGKLIFVLGSNRTFDRNSLLNSFIVNRKLNPVCLVLPDGDIAECQLYFNFSLECAKNNPDIKFIWRLHPLIKFSTIVEKSPNLRNLPDNIKLSTSTLTEDVCQSRWVLYRGTTAVISAVMAGVRPIYLQLPDEMTIDPLYELNVWRVKIANALDFKRIIEADFSADFESSNLELKIAQEYCAKFFTIPNVNVLINLLMSSPKNA